MFDNLLGIFVGASVVRGGRDRGASRLCARRRRLLQAVALGALMLPDVAWGQVTETLPEVTVTGPRPSPVRARRAGAPAGPPRGSGLGGRPPRGTRLARRPPGGLRPPPPPAPPRRPPRPKSPRSSPSPPRG